MSERILTVEGLLVALPVPAGTLNAVQDVSFHVDRGETLCIVGESGCGKTLTALAIMDLLPTRARRTAVRLELEGRDMAWVGERAMSDVRGNRIAMIFQDPMTSLNPAYTIGNQLEEALLRHRRVSRGQARERAVYLLDRVGITAAGSRLKQYPHQLSGGLRQRVMIAMALMCSPSLILADEPTTALDVTIQAQILDLLLALRREKGMGLILITHDMGVVAETADRVLVQYAGRQVETNTTLGLFDDPHHPYTAALLAALPERSADHTRLEAIPGVVPGHFDRPAGCVFSPRCAFATDLCREREPGAADDERGNALCHTPLDHGVPKP